MDPRPLSRPSVVGSKLDSAVDGASQNLRKYAKKHDYPYLEISAVVGTGIDALKYRLAEVVKETRSREAAALDAAE